jgi:predicted transglutaminase-like protease
MSDKSFLYKLTVIIVWNIPNKLTLTCDKTYFIKLGTDDETGMTGGEGV